MITKNHRSIRKIFVQKNDEKKRSEKAIIQTRATNKNAPQTHPSSAIIEDLTPNKTQRIQTSNNKSRISRNTSPQIHRINPIDGNRLKQNVGRWAYAQSTYKIPDLTTKKATDFAQSRNPS